MKFSPLHIRINRGILSFGFVLALFGAVIIQSSVAQAQSTGDASSISLKPASQSIALKAGQTTKGTITVINSGNSAYDFNVYGQLFSVKNEQYDYQFDETNNTTSNIATWIKLSESRYHLEAKQRIEVPYTIVVPTDASPGGHYGVIFAETEPVAVEGTAIARKKRVGSLILAKVAGDVKQQGAYLEGIVSFLQTSVPLSTYNRVQNSGNIDFQTEISMRISNVFGSVKYDENNSYVVYPGTVREIRTTWNDSPWFGLYKVEQNIKILADSHKVSQYVLMAPVWLLIVLIVVFAGSVGYIIYRVIRRLKRRKNTSAHHKKKD
ncbi:MAG: exported protein of unknown function [Candidatus Saccharibacteria bacterium]|nr:exported protein of unknown function [Candidatus Saccharibacteria bacterium]